MEVERQLKAIVQWIELNKVWISLEQAIGISGMVVNKRHICGVKEIFLPISCSILTFVCCHMVLEMFAVPKDM